MAAVSRKGNSNFRLTVLESGSPVWMGYTPTGQVITGLCPFFVVPPLKGFQLKASNRTFSSWCIGAQS